MSERRGMVVLPAARVVLSFLVVPKDRRSSDRRTSESSIVKTPRRRTERRNAERRLDERITLDLWIEQEAGPEVSYRHVGDLSAGGVRLDHGFSYPVGSRVKLRFALPDDPKQIEVAADVVAVSPEESRHHTSLRFVDLAGEDHIRITKFIDKGRG
ncbi:MAG: PilZ domain-containing protein [Myxococcota bacterium]|nr:PilZ domain-containing protein [Myxococcota bacterium]